MGHVEGKGLGRSNTGIVEPLRMTTQVSRSGLGHISKTQKKRIEKEFLEKKQKELFDKKMKAR